MVNHKSFYTPLTSKQNQSNKTNSFKSICIIVERKVLKMCMVDWWSTTTVWLELFHRNFFKASIYRFWHRSQNCYPRRGIVRFWDVAALEHVRAG